MKAKRVEITWTTIHGQECEKTVMAVNAEAEADRIRGLADVKTDTVKIKEQTK